MEAAGDSAGGCADRERLRGATAQQRHRGDDPQGGGVVAAPVSQATRQDIRKRYGQGDRADRQPCLEYPAQGAAPHLRGPERKEGRRLATPAWAGDHLAKAHRAVPRELTNLYY